MLFAEIQLFSLGFAAVIDTALLLVLLDRGNRQRAVIPLFILVFGAWLYHSGATVKALLADTTELWALRLHWSAMMAMAGGLLLMPSAMLHGVWRAGNDGFQVGVPADWRYGLAYLPLLAMIPIAVALAVDPAQPLVVLLAAWATPYLLWLSGVNLVAAAGFLRLGSRFEAPSVKLFVTLAGFALVALTFFHAFVFVIAIPRWPSMASYWQLVVALSPLPLVLLIGYFIIRFQFMQLVLERVFVYGAVVAAVVLFHRVFLQTLWQTLSDRYRINFAIVEALAIVALVLLYKPLRQRCAEALRYLLGKRMDPMRQRTRQLAMDMAQRSGQPPQDVLDWFVAAGGEALGVRFIAVWLFDASARVTRRSGETERLDDATAGSLQQVLKAHEQYVCLRPDAPTVAIEKAFQRTGTSLAVVLDQPNVAGLLLFGADLNQEQANAIVIVSEQLGIALNNSLLQASRLAAERRALQIEKLSTLGLMASAIAHEVKNPLSSIKTIATVVAEELGPDSDHARDLGLMISEIDRLAGTVTQLLQFARPTPTATSTVSVVAVIESTLAIMRHVARRAGVTVETDLARGLAPVPGDENALREVLFNLLSNAIEAARPDGRVTVSCWEEGGSVVVELGDSGPGLAPRVQQRLFEPFVTTKDGGTGLGLYVVGRRMGELGGEIHCQTDPGKGTLFTFKLPRVEA